MNSTQFPNHLKLIRWTIGRTRQSRRGGTDARIRPFVAFDSDPQQAAWTAAWVVARAGLGPGLLLGELGVAGEEAGGNL